MNFRRRLEKLEAIPPPRESILRAINAWTTARELPKDPAVRDFIEKWVMLMEGMHESIAGPPEMEQV